MQSCILTYSRALKKKKGSKTHDRANRTLFNQTKQDRMQFFEGIFFFKATNNTKTNKSLSCCQLGASIFFFFFFCNLFSERRLSILFQIFCSSPLFLSVVFFCSVSILLLLSHFISCLLSLCAVLGRPLVMECVSVYVLVHLAAVLVLRARARARVCVCVCVCRCVCACVCV